MLDLGGAHNPADLHAKAEPGGSIPTRPDWRFRRAGVLRIIDSGPGGTAVPRHLAAPAGAVMADLRGLPVRNLVLDPDLGVHRHLPQP
jgi:hypothetical protein